MPSNYCKVKTASATRVTCAVPGIDISQAVDTPYKLTMFGRLIEQASCDPSTACEFTFK